MGKGLGKGKGEGPMGEPYKEEIKMTSTDEIIDLIENEIGGEEDGEPNKIKNIPSQEPKEMVKRVEDDIIGDVNFDEDEPDEDVTGVGISNEMVDTTLLDQDNAYQAYFRTVMKKHNIEGIRGLSPDKRSAFFKDVSAGWRSKKKVKESVEEDRLNKKLLHKGAVHKKSRRRSRAIGGAYGSQKRMSDSEKRLRNKIAIEKSGKPWKTSFKSEQDRGAHARRRYEHGKDRDKYERALKRGETDKFLRQVSGKGGVSKGKAATSYPYKRSQSIPSRPGPLSSYPLKRSGTTKEDFEQYKIFCNYMMEQCGINDLTTLSEKELGNFFTLANEAFIMINELTQTPKVKSR